ncbi:MAG: L-histidine N(alpha)-methyltransferase [Rhodospirillales bacterium]|nr:L-histidine N(alpha)-methyltransferase [Rhodospirillales bacterium]
MRTQPDKGFRAAVLHGLAQPEKRIPCQYLYDQRGAALFERICQLDEYYLTRVEIGLLDRHAGAIAAEAGPRARLVEFGAGSERKARILLAAMESPAEYVPVDVSRDHLTQSLADLDAGFPGLSVTPVFADFMADFALPPPNGHGRTVGFFPGSTIGNLHPSEAVEFLRRAARVVGQDGAMLVGVDLKKDEAILNAAYNDIQGVTAAFSLNLLERINRELDGNFDVASFDHWAHYDAREGRVEIKLVSRRRQTVRVCGRQFRFDLAEPIHTEYSYKYSPDEFRWLARQGGFASSSTWIDDQRLFSLHYLRPAATAVDGTAIP